MGYLISQFLPVETRTLNFPNMPTTGDNCGPYMLGTRLGEGAFGAVYEATHQETGQRVALKFLLGSKQLEPEVQNRFVREVSLLQQLKNENIVKHYEAGLHEGNIYCAMELVECGSLKDVLMQRGSLPWPEAVEVTLQLCRALEHAHAKGCVHRDLKPANLFLSEDGLVKLGDLGLARDLNKDRLTQQGQTVGTWKYMAPEQIMGEENIDGRLDLYAVGCMLFEMIAGSVPFDGPDYFTIFDQHLETQPPRLDVVTGDCPRELADLVEHLLKKSPKERPENAIFVIERLEAILTDANPEDSAEESNEKNELLASGLRESPPNLTQRLQTPAEVGQKKPSMTSVAVVAVVVLLAILAYVALG